MHSILEKTKKLQEKVEAISFLINFNFLTFGTVSRKKTYNTLILKKRAIKATITYTMFRPIKAM